MTIWVPSLEGREGPRYVALADVLATDINEGRLAPGARLPTHRDLADRLGVTVGTISRAYAEAARRGLVSGEVGRGTFVRSRSPLLEPTVSREAGLLDLSQNHPPPIANPALLQSFEETLLSLARSRDAAALLEYPADGGNPRDREAGAHWIARTGLHADPQDVLVAAGSQHGITAVLGTLLSPGDVLLAEELAYPGLKAVASLLHLRLHELALDAEGVTPDAFEAACRRFSPRAIYLVPTLHNPTVATMSEARRLEIASLARAHDIAIIEDDVHALLPEERPRPIASLAPERTYYLMSTSKTLAPGLRTGFLLAPPGMFERLATSLRATAWSAPPLLSALATRWIEDGTAEVLLADRRRQAAARQALAREVLAEASLESDPASYFLWLHLPEPWRSDTFASEVRSRGVKVTSAEPFLVGRGPMPHAVRVCLGAATSEAELRRGLEQMAAALRGGRATGTVIV
jgi:DNA-binding transcriptional MocR family regulator